MELLTATNEGRARKLVFHDSLQKFLLIAQLDFWVLILQIFLRLDLGAQKFRNRLLFLSSFGVEIGDNSFCTDSEYKETFK